MLWELSWHLRFFLHEPRGQPGWLRRQTDLFKGRPCHVLVAHAARGQYLVSLSLWTLLCQVGVRNTHTWKLLMALKLSAQEEPISSLDSVWVAVNSVLSGAIPNLPDNLTWLHH